MSLDDDIAILSGVPTLDALERDALRLLAFSADVKRLRDGEILFHKGDAADGGYVVISGNVALKDGAGEQVLVGPGNLIGERALILEMARPATATAQGEVTVMRLSRALFRRTLEEYPQTAQRLADELASRIAATSSELSAVRKRLDRLK